MVRIRLEPIGALVGSAFVGPTTNSAADISQQSVQPMFSTENSTLIYPVSHTSGSGDRSCSNFTAQNMPAQVGHLAGGIGGHALQI